MHDIGDNEAYKLHKTSLRCVLNKPSLVSNYTGIVEIRLWRGVTVYITRMENEANVLAKLILTNCQGQVYRILGLLLFSA